MLGTPGEEAAQIGFGVLAGAAAAAAAARNGIPAKLPASTIDPDAPQELTLMVDVA